MQVLTVQDFAGALGQGFDLSLGESTMALTLVEVKPLPVQPFPGMIRSPFSLVFRSAAAVVLPQRIYRVGRTDQAAVDLFLVPIGRDVQGVLYQAVFN